MQLYDLKTEIKLLKVMQLSKDVENSFESLPNDHYLKEKFIYRKRRYSTGKIINQLIDWDNNAIFFQAEDTNNYLGGIERIYLPIEEVTKNVMSEIIKTIYIQELPMGNYHFGIHQIRIIANDQVLAKPAPEGIHKDGFDYISILCVKKENVSGGILMVINGENHVEILFEKELGKGEALMFSDKKYAHYTSAITPKIPNLEAIRDVIITTFTRLSD